MLPQDRLCPEEEPGCEWVLCPTSPSADTSDVPLSEEEVRIHNLMYNAKSDSLTWNVNQEMDP